jgi:hypothetical protein
LVYKGKRPFTVNSILGGKNGNKFKRAKLVKEYRDVFCNLAKAATIPKLDAMLLEVYPHHKDNRSPQDVAACCLAAKGGQDGFVDAKVVPDDSPQWLKGMFFFPPVIDGWDGLELVVREVVADGQAD